MRKSNSYRLQAASLCLFLFAVMLGVSACNDDPTSPASDLKSISGKIVLSATGAPVENAKVYLNQLYSGGCFVADAPMPAHQDSTLTNQFGRYSFQVPRTGSFQVFAGINDSSSPAHFSHLSDQLSVDMFIVESVHLVNLPLYEVVSGGAISGVVYNKDTGNVLENATISITKTVGLQTFRVGETTTDPLGKFDFPSLDTGVYQVRATAEVEIDSYRAFIQDTLSPVFLTGKASRGPYHMLLEQQPVCLP